MTTSADMNRARYRAHLAFDELWKGGYMTRKGAYRWLARQFPDGIKHIRHMDAADCDRLIRRVRQLIPLPGA